MSRDVKSTLKVEDLEGQIIYFLVKRYRRENGGGESILGPYLNKPKVSKWWAKHNIEHEILEYKLTKP